MKKVVALVLAVMLCMSLAACGEPAARTESEQYIYGLTTGEDQVIENLIFTKNVIVGGDAANITFKNCEFQGDIYNISDVGTRVILEGSELAGKCFIYNDVKEATIETALPKFIVDMYVEVICEDCIGSVVMVGEGNIIFNDKSYTISDSTHYYDSKKSEDNIVDYSGQEASVFTVAQWWENDEKQLLVLAE